ncbi:MAG: hypothetical protein JRE23_16265, partial [Deltaproteobacteria bacterium]|nr:hypothetical protein [Deltaproteobacteria bacterium]
MKKKKTIRNTLVVLAAVFVLTGCGSMRFATTLKPDPGMQGLQVADDVKFSIVQLDAAQDKKSDAGIDIEAIKTPDLRGHVVDVYPRLFGNDFADLPVLLDVDCTCSNSHLGAMLTGFTLGIIPFPSWSDVECKARSAVPDVNGYLIDETESFVLTNSMWLTLIGPLGLLPVPGRSDLPRDICFFDLSDETYMVRSKQLAMDSLTEAVARSIRRADPAKLKAASESRKARIRQIDINGQLLWSFLGFGFSKSKDQRDTANLLLYREYPTWGAKPVEQVVVARLKDGRWQPVTGYLRSVQELTAAYALIDDGKPSKVVIRKVDEPPLEDFIEL